MSPEEPRRVATLFPEPEAAEIVRLGDLCTAVERVLNLKPKQKKNTVQAVMQLSEMLTRDRSSLRSAYLSEPRILSAYMSYFLPWNVYRLIRLLKGLGSLLPLQAGDAITDLGCGPLTLAQALWAARPDLQQAELQFHCVDSAKKAVNSGFEVFKQFTGPAGKKHRIKQVYEPLERGLAGSPRSALIAGINVLNEWAGAGKGSLESRLERLFGMMDRHLAPGGRILLMEPGTRTGGRVLNRVREAALDAGFFPIEPCSHAGECPFPGESGRSWCHFSMSVDRIPKPLAEVTSRAKLSKDKVSLSFLLLAREDDRPEQEEPRITIISDPFTIPETPGYFRYGCTGSTQESLVVVKFSDPGTAGCKAGDILRPEEPFPSEGTERDAKTGAAVVVVTKKV